MIRRRRLLSSSVALPLLGHAAAAQAPYPSGPVRIVVPFAAGSATDNAARHIADGLGKAWGVPVVVDNKPGANGFIAAEAVLRAKPDGQTIFVLSNTVIASNAALLKSLPYDPVKDFEPITSIGFAPTFLLLHPSVPATNIQELVALARAQPGKLNFGSGSASTRISGEMLKARAKIDLVHVPYKSTPLAIQDLLAGHIQMAFADPVTGTPQIQAGTVRCLGVATNQRYKLTPQIPTIAEQGLGDFELYAWTAVYMAAAVPPAIRDKVHATVVPIINDPVYVARQTSNGSEIRTGTPADMRRIQLAEIALYREIMQAVGMEPE